VAVRFFVFSCMYTVWNNSECGTIQLSFLSRTSEHVTKAWKHKHLMEGRFYLSW